MYLIHYIILCLIYYNYAVQHTLPEYRIGVCISVSDDASFSGCAGPVVISLQGY